MKKEINSEFLEQIAQKATKANSDLYRYLNIYVAKVLQDKDGQILNDVSCLSDDEKKEVMTIREKMFHYRVMEN